MAPEECVCSAGWTGENCMEGIYVDVCNIWVYRKLLYNLKVDVNYVWV